MFKRLVSMPLYKQIILAIVAGSALGLLHGPGTAPLAELGRVIIQLI